MRARVLIVLALVVLAGCAESGAETTANPIAPCGALDTAFEVNEGYNPRVRMETSKGSFDMVVYFHQVPITAQNFLSLASEDFYDETRFHKLEPGVLIQGGDPFTASENKNFWGSGGPGYNIPDEFHTELRHDRAGMVSMANDKGPNSAGSQFMVHLQDRPAFDDRQPVFARVIRGMDVVQALSETPRDDRDRPQFNAELIDVLRLPPQLDPREATVSLSAYGFDCEQAASPAGTAEFLLSVRNTGQRILNGTFQAEAPDGWNVTVRNAEPSALALPSGQTVAYVVDARVPPTAEEGTQHTINVTFQDTDSPEQTSLELTVNVGPLGPRPGGGDRFELHYVGVLEDGRPFDTTIQPYTENPTLTWFKPAPTHTEPIPFKIEDGRLRLAYDDLPQGTRGDFPVLQDAATRTQLGQSTVSTIPPEDGYGTETWGQSNLGGRLLIFQVQVVSLNGNPATTG